MSSLPSGVRLVALLNEHLSDIMSRERTNTASIHLYCTGPYWVAFEYSAYQLRRVYARKHILRRDDKDYKQLTVPGLSLVDYREWHAGEVKGLPLLNN